VVRIRTKKQKNDGKEGIYAIDAISFYIQTWKKIIESESKVFIVGF
jgi:hypothetical protein